MKLPTQGKKIANYHKNSQDGLCFQKPPRYRGYGSTVTIGVALAVLFLLVHCKSKQTLFVSKTPEHTGIQFVNQLAGSDSLNIIEYLYYYNGSGVAIGDINNDDLPDIYLASNQAANKLYLNKGDLQFEDITESSGTAGAGDWKTGVSMVDINGDGWLDIYVCQVGNYKSIRGRNQLFINKGNLQFEERAAEYGLDFEAFSTQAAWLDFDRDGDLDMYLVCHSVHSTDTYRDTSIRHTVDSLKGDRLLENRNGRFYDISLQAGILSSPIGYGLGIGIGDLNGDHWPDIYIGNDFHENDYLYLNQQDGTFRQSQEKSFGHTATFSMGTDIGDLNQDGRLDIYSLDMKPDDERVYKSSVGADPYDIYQYKYSFGYHYQYPRNALQLNQWADPTGIPYFAEQAQQFGLDRTDWSWSPLIADFDNDGKQDIFVSNGIAHRPNDLDYLKYFSSLPTADTVSAQRLIDRMPDGSARNFFFRQAADFTWENTTNAWNPEGKDLSTAAAYADLDLDGDLDLVINRINAPVAVLENRSTGHQSVAIKLEYKPTNSQAVGTRLHLYAEDLYQMKEVYAVRGFQSSVDISTIHFGLGNRKKIDSMVLIWPTGETQVFRNPAVQPIIKIRYQPESIAASSPIPDTKTLLQVTSQPFDFRHRENLYNDFEREKLLLYKLSTQGAGIAIGDINQDGLEDLWMGGARGQAGVLFFQRPDGSMVRSDQTALEEDAAYEDIGAIWLDVDQDQDLDLIVISGGYQLDEPGLLQDRLYLNDGNGNLSRKINAFPSQSHMSGTIAIDDIDGDGDPDIFIGGRSGPYYGFNTDSYLLINDGRGEFRDSNIPILRGLGMVTDAVWAELDGDTEGKELILCGEWMPITILSRKGPGWAKTTIPNTEGLWQSILADDLDQDGDFDLVLGNLGMNSPFKANLKQSIDLYSADFDRNTAPESIISYYVGDESYSFFNKDELASQMVSFRKKYTDYKSFAQSNFKQVFADFDLTRDHKKIVELRSGVLENQGPGKWKFHPLPHQGQSSIVFALASLDLNGDSMNDLVIGGNLLETMPSFGRQDGSYGQVFLQKKNLKFDAIPTSQSGFFISGAVRDIKPFKIQTKNGLVVARNNDSPLYFELK
jgi:enediyne biosynthesis protein E4